MKLTYAERVAVAARHSLACARCGQHVSGLHEADVHHRVPRRMGGTRNQLSKDPRNLVLLCRSCHAWVESHRDLARMGGWLLRDYGGLNDQLVPLSGVPFLITADGEIVRDTLPGVGA